MNLISLLTDGSPQLPSIAEGDSNPAGITISELVVDGSIVGPNGTVAEAIAVEAVNTSLGAWQYKLAGTDEWLTIRSELINSTTNRLALLLGPNDSIRLLPFGDLNGTLENAIVFRAWDMSSGAAGEYVVTTPGVGPFSLESDTASLTVTPVNDLPTFAPLQGSAVAPIEAGPIGNFGTAVAFQADGKIVVAGETGGSAKQDFSVVRLNSDGTLDASFDGDGKLIIPVSPGSDVGHQLIIQPDGKVLIVGIAWIEGSYAFGVVRLNIDGSLDTGFAGDGIVTVPVQELFNRVGMTLQLDGKVLLAGGNGAGGLELVRLNVDGSLDTSFDGDGRATIPVGMGLGTGAVTVQPDGKILVAGSGRSPNSDFGVIRLNPDGSLDTSFDGDGVSLVSIGPTTIETARGLALQEDGKIVVVGSSYFINFRKENMSVIRLNSDGSLDTNFGLGGTQVFSLSRLSDAADGVSIQADGRIVLAGSTDSSSAGLVRLNSNGSLDQSFDQDGIRVIASAYADEVNVQPDGKIVVLGRSLIRLHPNGALDTTFNGSTAVTLGQRASFLENAAPIPLDLSVAIFDADLSALDSGAGNYSGASITLRRLGGANTSDLFSAHSSLNLDASDSLAKLSGVVIGSFTNSDGVLTISFNGAATQARVNQTLSSIAYANNSDAAPPNVVLEWIFSDGNNGSQGLGGGQTAIGYTPVTIEAVNDAPTGVVGITGTPTQGQTLTANTSNISDPDGLGNFSYVWKADGSVIVDATSNTLLLTESQVGKSITVELTYTDGQGFAEGPLASASPPLLVSGIPVEGGALTASLMVVNDLEETRSTGFVWQENIAGVWTNLAGQTASTLTIPSDQSFVGKTVRVLATITDGSGGSTEFTSAGQTIVNVNDFPSGGPVISGTPIVGETLTALVSDISDPDGMGLLRYVWKANGIFIAGATSNTLVPGRDEIGKAITVEVSYVDGQGFAEGPLVSAPTAHIADDVEASGTLLVTGKANLGGSLIASLSAVIDPDGVTTTYFAWQEKAGDVWSNLPGASAATFRIPTDQDFVGKIVRVVATTIDALGGTTTFLGAEQTLVKPNRAPLWTSTGSLDMTFSSDGKVTTTIGTGTDNAQSLVLQSDGKIILAGSSSDGSNTDYAVTRYNVDGSLDTSFANGGRAVTPIGSSSVDRINGLAIQTDGRVVAVGGTNSSNWDFSLVRYQANGTLDNTFDGDGKVITRIGLSTDEATAVAVQSDGKILVAGFSLDSNFDFAIVRYNSNGSLDNTFGSAGKVLTPIGSLNDYAQHIALEASGKFIVAGYSDNGTDQDFALVRYNSNGTIDTTFGTGGKVTTGIGLGDDLARSLVMQPDGKLVVVGFSAQGAHNDIALVRYNPDGTLDTTFDLDGKVTTGFSATSDDVGNSVSLQPDGKIVVVGFTSESGVGRFAVVRYNIDGSLDRNFGDGGKLATAVGLLDDAATAVALQADGKIVVGGRSNNGVDDDFALVRFGLDVILAPALEDSFTVSSVNALFASFFGDADGDAFAGIAISGDSSAITEGLWQYSTDNGITWISVGPVSPTAALLLSKEALLRFKPAENWSGTPGALSVHAVDESATAVPALKFTDGMTLATYDTFADDDSSAVSAGSTSLRTSIIAVDDTITLNASGTPQFPSIPEGAANADGTTVAALVVDGSVDDVDSAFVEAIAIEALNTSLGTWQYKLAGTTQWLTIRADLINSETNTLALLLGPSDSVRLLPYGDLNGSLYDAITFRAWDMSSGVAGEYAVTSPGIGGFSLDSDSAAISVTPVNDSPTFSPSQGGGVAFIPVRAPSLVRGSVVVQGDGRIVLVGNGSVMRLDSDGMVDASFGANGKASFGASASEVVTALQADGKIVLAGTVVRPGSGADFWLLRLNSDGTLDSTLDGDGETIIAVGPLWQAGGLIQVSDRVSSVAIQADGKILLAGNIRYESGSNQPSFRGFGIVRVKQDGTLDTSFGVDGRSIISLSPGGDYVESLVVQADGKILVAGYSVFFVGTRNSQIYRHCLIRLNTDGTLDTSFDTDGILVRDGGGLQGLAVQADGKIVAATKDGAVRFNADGSLDASFDGDGSATIRVQWYSENFGVALQSDGKILLVGRTNSQYGSDSDFSLTRLNSDGSLDSNFAGDGRKVIRVSPADDFGTSVSLQTDGRILLSGYTTNTAVGDTRLARLNADGSLDETFNGTGVNTLGDVVYYHEDTAPVSLDSAPILVVFDADLALRDNGPDNYSGTSLMLSRVGGPSSEDVFSGRSGLSLDGSAGEVKFNGYAFGTFSNSGGFLNISFNEAATHSLVLTALRNIAYANTSNTPPDSVSLQWTFSDGNKGEQGAGGEATSSGNTTIVITAVDDKQTLDAGAAPRLPNVAEGDNDPDGITISELIVDGSIVDPDSAVVEAVAIEGLDTSLGGWQYKLAGTDQWLSIRSELINSTTNTLALLLGPSDSIRLLPYGDLNGTIADAITFRSWDMSSGAAGEYVVTSVNSGVFSSTSDTASITVTPYANPTFTTLEGSGKSIIALGPEENVGLSVALQGDGHILVGGYSFIGSNYDFSVIRLNANGTIDPSFSNDGIAVFSVGQADDVGTSIAVQPDGKILLVGSSIAGANSDFSVVRLNSDGSFDTSFDGDGKVVIAVSSSDDFARSVAVQADGKIVVAGYSSNGTSYDFSLIRLNADGTLDNTFDADGKIIAPLGSSDDFGRSVVMQADGKIVVAGTSFNQANGNNDFGVIRWNQDGALDTTFGDGGKAIIAVGSADDIARSATLQPDGKILLAGSSYSPDNFTNDFSVVRLNPNGSPDTTFNEDGRAVIALGTASDEAQSVAWQSDGKILIAGTTFNSASYSHEYGLIRLNADGSLDASFGSYGKTSIPLGSSDSRGYSSALQTDGKIVFVGSSGTDFGVIRLLADGLLDSSFDSSSLESLGANVAYPENDPPVVLDSSVTIFDAERSALDNGLGNFAGSTITLSRQGGANGSDLFSGMFNLELDSADSLAKLSGVVIGTFTNAAGTLEITFNDAASQARVNAALSSLGYSNSSDSESSSVVIQWRFSIGSMDGSTGGNLSVATGITTVTFVAANDAPTGSPTITGTATQGQTLTADTSGIADLDGLGAFSYVWKADGTAIAGATSSTLVLTQAQVGKAITVEVSYTDSQSTAEGPLASLATGVVEQPATNAVDGSGAAETLAGEPTAVNLFQGLGGNDTVVGGSRSDVALYTGNRSDYTIRTVAGVTTVTDNRPGSPDGVDTLRGLNILRFADIQLFQSAAANRTSLAGGAQRYEVANAAFVGGTNAAERFVVSDDVSVLVSSGAGDTVDLAGTIDSYTFRASGNQLQLSDGVYTIALTVSGTALTLRTASGSTTVAIDFAAGGAIKLGGTQVVGSATFDALSAILNADNVSEQAQSGLRAVAPRKDVAGTSAGETLTGSSEVVSYFTGGGGNDTLVGGSRADVAVFSGNRADYTIRTVAGVTTVTDNRGGSPDGVDTLRGLNILRFADVQLFQSAAANRTSLAGGVQRYEVSNSEFVAGTNALEHYLVAPGVSALVSSGAGDTVDIAGAIDTYSYRAAGNQLQLSDGVYTIAMTVSGTALTLRTASGSTTVAIDFAAGGVIKLGGTQIVGSATFDPAAAILDPLNMSEVQALPIRVANGVDIIARAGVAEDFLIDASQLITASIRGFEPGDELIIGNRASELGIIFDNVVLGDGRATLLAGEAAVDLVELAADLFGNEGGFEVSYGPTSVTYVI